MWTIILIILTIILVIGIIRIIINPPNDLFDFILELTLLDLFGDLIEGIANSDSDNESSDGGWGDGDSSDGGDD